MNDAFPIIDLREWLPRRSPRTRALGSVYGCVVHHTAGDLMGPQAVARYHVNDRGWQSIGYHYWVEPDGTVYRLNDVREVINSQGGAGAAAPVPYAKPNLNFMAVVFRGDFTNSDPSPEARVAFRWLWAALRSHFGFGADMLFTHRDFKPTLCPGRLALLVTNLVDSPSPRDRMPTNVVEAQRALVALGYDLGRFGPNRDGADGLWGAMSADALDDFIAKRELDFRAAYALGEALHRQG